MTETHGFTQNELLALFDRAEAYPGIRAAIHAVLTGRSESPSPGDGLDALDRFNAENATLMRERLRHGAQKFGDTSWRDSLYPDADNNARLNRAVDHLVAALHSGAGPDETRKRAADVANQAFMFADPLRDRGLAATEQGTGR